MVLTCEIRTLTGESLGVILLNEKTFKSGKSGWFGTAKVVVDGIRYQTQAQMVKIAGQDAPEPDAAAAPESEQG